MTFAKRPIAAQDTLGERLRQLREEARLTPEEIGAEINVAPKYIMAIEACRYGDLPGLVYARNFVRLYATRMRLPIESAMERFEQEYQVVKGTRAEAPRLVQRAQTDLPWVQRHFRFVLASTVLLVVVGYFSWQVYSLLKPPSVTLVHPTTDVSTRDHAIVVQGSTEPETQVSINNEEVEVSKTGTFTVSIDLQTGLNVLKLTAKKKHSRERVILRNILVEK